MKKLILVFTVVLSLLWQGASSQNLIAVQNGGAPAFFTQVTTAIEEANSGDTIYIPGGSWSIGSLNINKTLHIIGVGYNPDSAQVSGYTYLSGSIELQQGCSYGSLMGLYITETVMNNSPTDTIKSFSIRRCKIKNSFFLNHFSDGLVAENIIEGQVANNFDAFNNSFNNNIFTSNVGYFGSGNNFKNNLFLSPDFTAWSFYSCLFENNVIFTYNFVNPMFNCIFKNNLFTQNITFPFGTNLGFNNIVNQDQSSIFVNGYHLQASCPGINAGTDGTDIGIYGGMFPWKDGSLPPNPHILQKIIQQSTDSTGNLKVNIKVAAQDR